MSVLLRFGVVCTVLGLASILPLAASAAPKTRPLTEAFEAAASARVKRAPDVPTTPRGGACCAPSMRVSPAPPARPPASGPATSLVGKGQITAGPRVKPISSKPSSTMEVAVRKVTPSPAGRAPAIEAQARRHHLSRLEQLNQPSLTPRNKEVLGAAIRKGRESLQVAQTQASKAWNAQKLAAVRQAAEARARVTKAAAAYSARAKIAKPRHAVPHVLRKEKKIHEVNPLALRKAVPDYAKGRILGFEGVPRRKWIESGTMLSRYSDRVPSKDTGKFLSPAAVGYAQRSLRPSGSYRSPQLFVATRRLRQLAGPAAGDFGYPGGGEQFWTGRHRTIAWLIRQKHLRLATLQDPKFLSHSFNLRAADQRWAP